MHEPLRFQPIYQERVWGGRRLASAFGRDLPGTAAIGESWEIVDRPEAQSVIAQGRWAGRTLREAITAAPTDLMGPRWEARRPFPILVKWLDCRERLSLQVHPPASVAPALKGEPKTENWFIADADPGAGVLVGLQPGVDRAHFEQALDTGRIEGCVRRLPVRAGDSILVRSGTVHAIDAGCLILEIQQNSDTTYRVYDWGRMGTDGKPRTLHRRESLASILWSDDGAELVSADQAHPVLADAPEFRLRQVRLEGGKTLTFTAGEQPRLLGVVSGALTCAGATTPQLRAGENVLVPYAATVTFTAEAPTTVLVTENFA